MVTRFGEAKAQAKVDSGKLEDRADPDSGLLDKDNKEWKIFDDEGQHREVDRDLRKMSVEEDLTNDKAGLEEMQQSFSSSKENMAGNATVKTVKQEPQELEDGAGKAVDLEMPVEEEESKVVKDLKRTPKVVLRNLAEDITNLKEMFHCTAGNKYTAELHADISKLIPKFAKHYKTVETMVLGNSQKGEIQQEECLAIGTKIDKDYEELNAVKDPYVKFFPKAKRQRTSGA